MRLLDSYQTAVSKRGDIGLSNKNLTNAAIVSGHLAPIRTNNPAKYADRQHQYFDNETRLFISEKAKYASDFMEAKIQGVTTGSLDEWKTYRIRMADIVRPTSAIQRRYDDYKQILFESRNIEYLRWGTKIVTMGSTWLAINPQNVSGASGQAVVRRCNAVWNHYDFYGNVLSEPIIVENDRASASDSDSQEGMYISKGYFQVSCQANPDTLQIDTNTRMILGTGAYRVTGYADFETEFTGEYDTIRMLFFTIRYEEPNRAIDDMENHVASGKKFSWQVLMQGANNLRAGSTTQFAAISVRNGETVTDSEEHPISYIWQSSDETVATVDIFGNVTAVGEGAAVITATLDQNPDYSASMAVVVTETEDGIYFTSTIPDTLKAFDSVTLTAAYFEDGEETTNPLTWAFSGADESTYSAVVSPDGLSATITGYAYSDTPLTILVSCGVNTVYSGSIVEIPPLDDVEVSTDPDAEYEAGEPQYIWCDTGDTTVTITTTFSASTSIALEGI